MFVALGVGGVSTWVLRDHIILWLLAPAQGKLSETGLPIFTGPTEMFWIVLRLSVIVGVLTGLLVLVGHAAWLIWPVLPRRHRRFVALFLPAGLGLYLAGAAFAYLVLLPIGLGFLLTFGADLATPAIRIAEYMELALAMLLWMGVIFELPLAMLLLAKLKIVGYKRFRKLRIYVPTAALILGMIITPPDLVTQFLVAVPMILLFETGMLLSWLARPRPLAGERMP